jgi:hypothetical protein
MTEIRLYKSPWKAIRLILISTPFVALGIYVLVRSDSSAWVGWLNICFFGLVYPLALFQIFDRRPQIVINKSGICDRSNRLGIIKWEIIKNAYLIDIYRQKFICLVVDEENKPSKKKGRFYNLLAGFSETIGGQEVNLSVGPLKVDANKLLKFILEVIQAEKSGQDKHELIRKYVI